MILRAFCRLPTALLSALLLFLPYSLADNSELFDCRVTVRGVKFNMMSLGGMRMVNRTYDTPPTTTIYSLRFDLCDDLKQLSDVPEGDQVRHHVLHVS